MTIAPSAHCPPPIAPVPAPRGLFGRGREWVALARLLDQVEAGHSATLVLHGDLGAGKTTLLRHLQDHATGWRVVRTEGLEAARAVRLGGLRRLVGLGPHAPGAALTDRLARAALREPVLCIVDDAHWLDRESLCALAEAAWAIPHAAPVAMVFAHSAPGGLDALIGLREMAVGGLAERDARVLLRSVLPCPLDARVEDRIVARTAGNALALSELARWQAPDTLADALERCAPPDLADLIAASYRRRIERLPAITRRLLTMAAVDPCADPARVWSAARPLGANAAAVAAANAAGILEFGHDLRFHHPLARAAALDAATAQERHEAYRALRAVPV